jgi:hypothetical protein
LPKAAASYAEIRTFYRNNLPSGWTGPAREQTRPLDGGGQQQLAGWTKVNQAGNTEQVFVLVLASGAEPQEISGGDNYLVLFLLSP